MKSPYSLLNSLVSYKPFSYISLAAFIDASMI
nr:MAG TPA: hypothetical protein [Caudoviricetes sp.]